MGSKSAGGHEHIMVSAKAIDEPGYVHMLEIVRSPQYGEHQWAMADLEGDTGQPVYWADWSAWVALAHAIIERDIQERTSDET